MAPEKHRGYSHKGQILVEPLAPWNPSPSSGQPSVAARKRRGRPWEKSFDARSRSFRWSLPVRRRIWRSCLDFEPLTLTCHRVQRLATPRSLRPRYHDDHDSLAGASSTPRAPPDDFVRHLHSGRAGRYFCTLLFPYRLCSLSSLSLFGQPLVGKGTSAFMTRNKWREHRDRPHSRKRLRGE